MVSILDEQHVSRHLQPLRGSARTQRRPAGSPLLEWQILDDEEPWDDQVPIADGAPAGRNRFGRRAIAGLLAVLVAGAALYLWHRAETGAQLLEDDLRKAVAIEPWLTPSPRAGHGPAATVQAQDITFHRNVAGVRVLTAYVDPDGRTHTSRQLVFYQPTTSGWVRLAPAPSYLGARQVRQTDGFTFRYFKADAAAVEAVAAEVDTLYTGLRHDYGLPPAAQHLVIEIDGAKPIQSGWNTCLGGQAALCVPSPALSAMPGDLTEQQALRLWILDALVSSVQREALEADPLRQEWQYAGAALARLQMRRHDELPAAWHAGLAHWLYGSAPAAQTLDALCDRHEIPQRQQLLGRLAMTHLCVEPPRQELAQLARHGPPERLARLRGTDPDLLAASDSWVYGLAFDTALDYALAIYGPDVLPALVEGFRRYGTWDSLIPAVFGVSAEEFERGWRRWIGATPRSDAEGAARPGRLSRHLHAEQAGDDTHFADVLVGMGESQVHQDFAL